MGLLFRVRSPSRQIGRVPCDPRAVSGANAKGKGMSLPNWQKLHLAEHILREATPDKTNIVVWVARGLAGGAKRWERIGNVVGREISAAQGVLATAATAVTAKERVRSLFGKLFGFIRQTRVFSLKMWTWFPLLGLGKQSPWRGRVMSTSLLYHGFGIVGYRHVSESFEGGQVTFRIEQPRQRHRCSPCGSAEVCDQGGVEPTFPLVPIGPNPTLVKLTQPPA